MYVCSSCEELLVCAVTMLSNIRTVPSVSISISVSVNVGISVITII